MKRADEIKIVKADIRRLKNRQRCLRIKQYTEGWLGLMDGINDAIATLEKYLAKIEK